MPIITKWRAGFSEPFFSSGTVAATDDTGIIATSGVVDGGQAIHPLFFLLIGTGLTADETAAVTIDWYVNAAGDGGAIGTTTFNTIDATTGSDLEVWPGDVTAYNAGRDLVPLFPYHKVTYTLVGTVISMSLQILMGSLRLDA